MASPEWQIHGDVAETVEALADALVRELAQAVAARGVGRIALAGGGTPRALYRLLASEPWQGRVEWGALEVFWGDERCVPPDHPESNTRMAREALLDHVPVDPGRVHAIDTALPPEEAAAAYAAVLGDAPLDVVLLGMGGDGHTASLFAWTPRLREERRAVVATNSPVPPEDRVTMSLRTLRRARAVWFLVTGGSKAELVEEVCEQLHWPLEQTTLPAAMVRPRAGSLRWYVDGAAAAQLTSEAGA